MKLRLPAILALAVVCACSVRLSAQTAQAGQITGIAHIAYRAGDLDKEVAFLAKLGYQESFGFTNAAGKRVRANLLGHARTRDPKLERWEILSTNAPLLGVSDRAPDGVENVMIFRTGERWTMLYSEGLANQHLAFATSEDLLAWEPGGVVELPRQKWMARKYGAPFVWREPDQWLLILMGQSSSGKTTFGLLTSPDGQRWTLLPEAP